MLSNIQQQPTSKQILNSSIKNNKNKFLYSKKINQKNHFKVNFLRSILKVQNLQKLLNIKMIKTKFHSLIKAHYCLIFRKVN